jgi:hypothetical protein
MAVSRVQPGLGQSNPPHPAQPVAALGGTEGLFDPAAHVADLCVMRLETIEGCLASPGACLHSARYTCSLLRPAKALLPYTSPGSDGSTTSNKAASWTLAVGDLVELAVGLRSVDEDRHALQW